MKKSLEKFVAGIQRQGATVEVKDAPKDANTFDKMIVVYFKPDKKASSIWQIHFYNSETQEVVGTK